MVLCLKEVIRMEKKKMKYERIRKKLKDSLEELEQDLE